VKALSLPIIGLIFALGALPALAAETQSKVAVADLPNGVIIAVKAAIPDITLTAATRKDRDGRTYYDVEGKKADGSEIELDLLAERTGFRVVEIQRDLKWQDVPAVARDAAMAAKPGIKPVRVIESTEDDGSVIYELFAEGKPEKPAMEVRVVSGKATVLSEVWPH
jgi:hypothetical protein